MTRLEFGETAQLATRVPKALHRAALVQAIEDETTLQRFIFEALTEHLARVRAGAGPKRRRRAAAIPPEGAEQR